jgi:hypothetical protein
MRTKERQPTGCQQVAELVGLRDRDYLILVAVDDQDRRQLSEQLYASGDAGARTGGDRHCQVRPPEVANPPSLTQNPQRQWLASVFGVGLPLCHT